jgi:putative transposase
VINSDRLFVKRMRILGQDAVLRGEIAGRLRELVRHTCATLDLYILSGHSAEDYVHLLVSMPPQVSVSQLMQRIKDRSSRKMLEAFGELSRRFWGRHPWARGYFAASSGNVTDEIIKQYIESQSEKPPSAEDDGFTIGELKASFARSPSYRL